MILHGRKKKILKDLVRYYVNTTGKTYDEFILGIQKSKGDVRNTLNYPDWLAVKCYHMLEKEEITIADCIENKDTIRSAISADDSRNDGEFFTPEVWAKDGREYLKAMLGDLYGKAYIWEGSCGTGNLLKTSSYPKDKLFMSTLLEEDVTMVKSIFPDVPEDNIFQCDFVNGIDWDSYNMEFSNKLPKGLREVLENNEPLIFFMNPPYKVMASNSSDVGDRMASLGMGKCALDIFHQFMYRILMLKRFYKLTNVYLGIFGPITMFHSDMLKDLYEDFKTDFIFEDGMCFAAGDFANTSESVGWIVGYTCWRSKTEEEQENGDERPVLLTAKRADQDNNISIVGQRLIRNVNVNLHNWVDPDSLELRAVGSETRPKITSMFNYLNDTEEMLKNAMGYMMSSNYVIRATRRACCTSLPIPDGTPVLEENFWRCVASYGARRCYATDSNPYNNCQYYSKPDENVSGYEEWLNSALALFLFDYNSQWAGYRDLTVNGETYPIVENRMFPLCKAKLREFVTDENILADMDKTGDDYNNFIVQLLGERIGLMCDEAKELCEFCANVFVETLSGDVRKRANYSNHTVSWDAGIVQLRTVPEIWSQEKEEKYTYLIARLKDKLLDGVYKFGFMMDVEFSENEEDIEVESEDLND